MYHPWALYPGASEEYEKEPWEQMAANAVKPWLLGGLQEQVKQTFVRNDTATADLAMVSGEWSWIISWGSL